MSRYEVTNTQTGEILDLTPLSRPPRPTRYNSTRRRVRRGGYQDDAMFMLAAMTALLAAIALVN